MRIRPYFFPFIALLASACSGTSQTEQLGAGPAATQDPETGRLLDDPALAPATGSQSRPVELRLVDAPTEEVTEVVVTIAGVDAEVLGTGWSTLVDKKVTVDLLQLQGQTAENLGVIALPTGHVSQLRLRVDENADNYVTTADGVHHPLTIPSGSVKFVGGINVGVCLGGALTLDFDAQKSVHTTGNDAVKMVGAPDAAGTRARSSEVDRGKDDASKGASDDKAQDGDKGQGDDKAQDKDHGRDSDVDAASTKGRDNSANSDKGPKAEQAAGATMADAGPASKGEGASDQSKKAPGLTKKTADGQKSKWILRPAVHIKSVALNNSCDDAGTSPADASTATPDPSTIDAGITPADPAPSTVDAGTSPAAPDSSAADAAEPASDAELASPAEPLP